MGDGDGLGRLRCALELGFYLTACLSWATPPLCLPVWDRTCGHVNLRCDLADFCTCTEAAHLYLYRLKTGGELFFPIKKKDSAGGRKELEILWQFTKTWSYDKEITVQGSSILLPTSLLYERHERNAYCDRVMTLLIKPAY